MDVKSTVLLEKLPCLDGLRGIAAGWVLLSHIQVLSGMRAVPVLSWGGLAVDLFMMLSGLLMTHHYLLREQKEPWGAPRTWRIFWTRRFFRIAPLYYVLLLVAFAIAPLMLQGRSAIASIWPYTATSVSRYAGFDPANFVTHVTFVFGVLPSYAFRTPLPDWSIGLEMQFYLVFPMLMLLFRRCGIFTAGIGIIFFCMALRWVFREVFAQFEMPAFLPMKLYVFVMGMWLAVGRFNGRMTSSLLGSLAVSLAMLFFYRTAESLGLVLLTASIYYLLSDGSLPFSKWVEQATCPLRAGLSCSTSRALGDLSYGLYLVHLLVLIPVAGLLTANPMYVQSSSIVRFSICLILVAPISYALAWVGYKCIEVPGIAWGKKVVGVRRIGFS